MSLLKKQQHNSSGMKKYRKDIESERSMGIQDGVGKASDENPILDLFNDSRNYLPASRRDFLKLCGFSFAVSALSSCESKISKAVPYVNAPVESTPGEALYYASSYINGNDYCSIIVKTRDGRPIKIEGNPESGITRGGTNARVQASVLDLYDGGRFHGPLKEGLSAEWELIDNEIIAHLEKIVEEKGTIVLLTPTIFSPSTEAVISGFLQKFKGSEWVQYDAISYSAMLEANKISFGKQVIPDYRFDKADLIVSVGADFLGTWLSPVEYTKQFSSGRIPENKMNWLIQLESCLSLTGSNADKRIQIKPSEEYAILLNIYKGISKVIENRIIEVPVASFDVTEITEKLLSSKGKSIVISGTNVKRVQLLTNEINRMLGNIGQTILFRSFLRTHMALDSNMEQLTGKMQKGEVKALLVWTANPAYTWYKRDAFKEGLKNVDLTISLSGSPDETNNLVRYNCPDHHYLESWNDVEAKRDYFSFMQPAINQIFDTRHMADSLLKWSGSTVSYYDFIKAYWVERMMSRQSEFNDPVAFFDHVLQKGIFEPSSAAVEPGEKEARSDRMLFKPGDISTKDNKSTSNTEIVFYETIALGEGRQANNPWLQELPDPITRICWDNYITISPSLAKEYNLNDNEVINLGKIEVPVHIQPGQAPGTVGIALGYGRSRCGKVGDGVGKDVWTMLISESGNIAYSGIATPISKTGKIYDFAQTQTHHSMEGRAFVREAALDEFKKNPAAGNEEHAYNLEHNKSLYKERSYPHHHWGMAIDLSKCTGCGNCVIACQAENNVPVVGKEEVHRVHEMHWLRIDRYFTGEEDNPEVVFQPVLCQHCQNAPCENVCPVAATNHSSEGLNQMIYNRCFGTRYCNNNCPYKVRRFNWFNYSAAGTLGGNLRDKEGMTGNLRRMVLNPDVTVRAQGVIEKCSFCVQRIQAAKLKAKYENRALRENDIQTACSQSCPANAIVFGDMNDQKSELNRLIKSGRRYNLLEELFTMPSVNYLTKIKNKTV
jgi:Fe-S-cluster-containing dehydrogenase component/anaerobic selenocysteine-containing dehydrogenase